MTQQAIRMETTLEEHIIQSLQRVGGRDIATWAISEGLDLAEVPYSDKSVQQALASLIAPESLSKGTTV